MQKIGDFRAEVSKMVCNCNHDKTTIQNHPRKGLYTNEKKKSTGFANKFRRNHKTKRMVRMLDEICVELDYRALYRAYSRKLPKGAASPEDMFRILVYGYMTGNYSSRKIEEACRSNINFMWLLDGAEAPDHNKISRFRTGKLKNVIEDLFAQLTNKLQELGEIECKNLFIDGTKIEANANRYSFVWRNTVRKQYFP